ELHQVLRHLEVIFDLGKEKSCDSLPLTNRCGLLRSERHRKHYQTSDGPFYSPLHIGLKSLSCVALTDLSCVALIEMSTAGVVTCACVHTAVRCWGRTASPSTSRHDDVLLLGSIRGFGPVLGMTPSDPRTTPGSGTSVKFCDFGRFAEDLPV